MKILNKIIEGIVDKYSTSQTWSNPAEFDSDGFDGEMINFFDSYYFDGEDSFIDSLNDLLLDSVMLELSNDDKNQIEGIKSIIKNQTEYRAGMDFIENLFTNFDIKNKFIREAITEFLYWFDINFDKTTIEFNQSAVDNKDKY